MQAGRPALDGEPPQPVSFRTEYFEAGTVFPSRSQPWGEFNYAVTGVAEFNIAGRPYLSPPHYAIWLPPDTLHDASTPRDSLYVSVYVKRQLCAKLPRSPATLSLSELLKAILADFAKRQVTLPRTPEDLRLANVLVDQIGQAPRCENYLPFSKDALLGPVLEALQARPGDRRSLAEWARRFGTTERTLSRRSRDELGMSFNEWRQRQKLVASLALLEAGHSVSQVGKELGYSNTSAFIAMFRRLTGSTPRRMKDR